MALLMRYVNTLPKRPERMGKSENGWRMQGQVKAREQVTLLRAIAV